MTERKYFLREEKVYKKCVRKKYKIVIIKVKMDCTDIFNDRQFNERENFISSKIRNIFSNKTLHRLTWKICVLVCSSDKCHHLFL